MRTSTGYGSTHGARSRLSRVALKRPETQRPRTPTQSLLQTPYVIPGLLLIGIGGLLLPRLVEGLRRSRAIARELNEAHQQAPLDLHRARALHDALTALDSIDALDDATWRDLDLDAVFASIDRTASQIGRQYLYHVLRAPSMSGDVLVAREQAKRGR